MVPPGAAEGREVMALTAAQIRRACRALKWRSPMLARRARVTWEVARRAQSDEAIATVSTADLEAIGAALRRAGAPPPGEGG